MAYTKSPVRVRVRVMREHYLLCWDKNSQNMAVPSASGIQIINVSLFNGDVSSEQFSKATAVVQDVNNTLLSIIRREAVRASEKTKHTHSDIKSTRVKNDLYVLQLMSLPL